MTKSTALIDVPPAKGPSSSADGWRGLIGSQFTCDSAMHVLRAIVEIEESMHPGPRRFLISCDARHLGEEVASAAMAFILARPAGHHAAFLRHVPTATASFLTTAEFDAAILITASHNGADWNGVKLKVAPGLSAPPAVIDLIDRRIATQGAVSRVTAAASPNLLSADATACLARHAKAAASHLPQTARRRFRVAIDGLGGIAEPAMIALGQELGWQTLPSGRKPAADFGGLIPDPSRPAALTHLAKRIREANADFGLALDGDGDRIYALDEAGAIVQPSDLMALLGLFEHDAGRCVHDIAVTQSTGASIRLAAARIGAALVETPIGFKYIAGLLSTGRVDIGGGAVGDLAFRTRARDRDPLCVAAHLSQLLADRGRPLSVEIRDLQKMLGTTALCRIERHFLPGGALIADACERALGRAAPLAGINAGRIETLEKGAMRLRGPNNQWLMLRESTTEGGVRLYGEVEGLTSDMAFRIGAMVAKHLGTLQNIEK
jgi:phosphomannomutase